MKVPKGAEGEVMDPRKPKRPDDERGDSWSRCRSCAREADHVRNIRHEKRCIAHVDGERAVAEAARRWGEQQTRLPPRHP